LFGEEKFILVGFNDKKRILTVCHCYRGVDETVTRIISARKATKYEEKIYNGEDCDIVRCFSPAGQVPKK